MQSDVTVTMAPLDPELSEVIISDKHWLIENALCLLSNAVKYSSEGGAVQLTTELVRMRHNDDDVLGEVTISPIGRGRKAAETALDSESEIDNTHTDNNADHNTTDNTEKNPGNNTDNSNADNNTDDSNANEISPMTHSGTNTNSAPTTNTNNSGTNTSSNANGSTSTTSSVYSGNGTNGTNVNFSNEMLMKAMAQAKMKERAISVLLASAQEEGVKLMIRITVEDTGIGIPDDVKCGLFQPFAQAQRYAGGTGLGKINSICMFNLSNFSRYLILFGI